MMAEQLAAADRAAFTVFQVFALIHQKASWSRFNQVVCALRFLYACPFSKLHPHEFIGGFERPAIACVHGEAGQTERSRSREESREPSLLLLEGVCGELLIFKQNQQFATDTLLLPP
jgi:hypothetical protein